jgi:TetR/AcrR family transcriptional regulator
MSTAARRERERLQRHVAIVEAAERVFTAKGYAAATMEDIAAEAELSKGALYLYFKTKDELFVAQSVRPVESIASLLEAELAGRRRGLAVVQAQLLAYATFAQTNPRQFANAMQWILVGNEIDPASPTAAQHNAALGRVLGALATAIGRGQADGSIRAELDPITTGGRLWAAMIGALIVRLNTERLTRGFPADSPARDTGGLVPGLVDDLCRGLATAAVAATSKEPS